MKSTNILNYDSPDIIHRTLKLIPLFDIKIKQQYKPALPDGITRSEMDIMFAIASKDAVRMHELTTMTGKGKQHINFNVGLLEKNGYVIRETDTMNRKIVRVSITEKGIRLLNEYDTRIYRRMSGKFDLLTSEEKEKLINAIDDISEILEKL